MKVLPRFILLGALMIGAGCGSNDAKTVKEEPVISVVATKVKRGDIISFIYTTGTIVPRQESMISPKTSGRIEKLYVDEGDKVKKGQPLPLDAAEPHHLLEAVQKLDLSYVVITSVTRDDLGDGGAAQFATAIKLIHEQRSNTRVEVLIPDFRGSLEALRMVIRACPDVINHNLETVPRCYPEVRPGADYARSLEVLARVKELDRKIVTKSGLMVGLGETKEEIIAVMRDLRRVNCDLLTIGQYLSPSATHHPAMRYVNPDEFTELAEIGRNLGFAAVAAAPLVRSSFRAAELYGRVGSSERLARRSETRCVSF